MAHQQTRQTKATETGLQRHPAVKPPTSAPPEAHPILALQHQIGNRAVTQLLQAKLTVGEPGDVYEQEADRVAEQVMHMPEPLVQRQPPEEEEEKLQTKPLTDSITPLVQRQMPEEEEEKLLQRQTLEEEEEPLQRQMPEEEEEKLQTKAASPQTPAVAPEVEAHIQSMRGNGHPLPDSSRAFFEPRFGTDFSGVRLHTDSTADSLNRSLNARAFTTGQDVFFRQGEYDAGSARGKELLAHELTHVVQQGHGICGNCVATNTSAASDWVSPKTVQQESELKEPQRENKADKNRTEVWNNFKEKIYDFYPFLVHDSWGDMNHKLTDLMSELNDLVEANKAEEKAVVAMRSSFLSLVEVITELGGDILIAMVSQYYERLIDLNWRGTKEKIPKLRDEVWEMLQPQADKFKSEADRFIEDPRVKELFERAYSSYVWKEYNESERAEFRVNFSRDYWLDVVKIYKSSYTLQWREILNSTIGAAIKREISSKIFETVKPSSIEVPNELSPDKIKQFVDKLTVSRVSRAAALYIKSGYSMIFWQVVRESAPSVLAFKQELDNAEAGRFIGGLSSQALEIFDVMDNFFALDEVAIPLFRILDLMKKAVPIIDLDDIGEAVDDAIREIVDLRTSAGRQALDTRKQVRKYFELEMSSKRTKYQECFERHMKLISGVWMPSGKAIPSGCLIPRPFFGFHGEYRNAAIRHGVVW